VEITRLDDSYRDIIGYLPQDFGFYRNYSPMQFLIYIAALKGIDGKTAKIKALELLELVSLSDVKNKKMRKFSGGMIQRVGIAQAMLNCYFDDCFACCVRGYFLRYFWTADLFHTRAYFIFIKYNYTFPGHIRFLHDFYGCSGICS